MVTRKEIAERAGVSPTLISHVLNNTPGTRINAATREKVLQAARDLGYIPNALARALVEKRIRHLGLAIDCSERADAVISHELISGITGATAAAGYHVLLCPLTGRSDTNLADRLIEMVSSHRVDGLIINKEDVLTVEVEKLLAQRIPLILVNSYRIVMPRTGTRTSSLGLDLDGGIQTATNELFRLGHRRIALFPTEHDSFPDRNHRVSDLRRIDGYQAALQAHDCPFDPALLPAGEFSRTDDLEAALDRLLALPAPPTAMIAATDRIALRLADSLKRRGLKLPEQMSLIGGGDSFYCDSLEPGLSSLKLPFAAMGALAAERLIRQLNDADETPDCRLTILPVELRLRSSIAEPGR